MFRGSPAAMAASGVALGVYCLYAYKKETDKLKPKVAEEWQVDDTKMWNQGVLDMDKKRKKEKAKRKQRKEWKKQIEQEQAARIEEYRNNPAMQAEYARLYGASEENVQNSLKMGLDKAHGGQAPK